MFKQLLVIAQLYGGMIHKGMLLIDTFGAYNVNNKQGIVVKIFTISRGGSYMVEHYMKIQFLC